MKECIKCGKELELSDFSLDVRTKDKLKKKCDYCLNKKKKEPTQEEVDKEQAELLLITKNIQERKNVENTSKKQKEELTKQMAIVYNSFPAYVIYAFKLMGIKRPTPLQLDMAKELQAAMVNGNKRVLFEAFRGIGKTLLAALFAAWRLYRNKEDKILIISASQGHATNISTLIKSIIETDPILKFLAPDANQRNSKLAFDVGGCKPATQPSVKCLGINSQLQGNRATLLIADDIETSINSQTEIMREKIKNQVAEFDSIIKTDDDVMILGLGTPQSVESIYNDFVTKGFLIRIWPAMIPESVGFYQGRIAPYIETLIEKGYKPGDSTDTRFTVKDLLERQVSTGKSYFTLHYMLDTTLSDANKFPLKQSDFIVMDIGDKAPAAIMYSNDPRHRIKDIPNIGFSGDGLYNASYIDDNYVPFQLTYMSIDPAGKGKDETSYSIISLAHGKVFIRDIGGFHGGYSDENLMKLALLAKTYGVQKIFIESNFGDGMFLKLISPYVRKFNPGCELEDIRNNKNKELRIIDTIEPLLNQHKLVIDRNLLKRDITGSMTDENNNSEEEIDDRTELDAKTSYSFIYQLTHITKQRGAIKHDDRLDALQLVLGQLDEHIGMDSDEALSIFKKESMQNLLDEHMENYLNNGMNYKPIQPSIFTSYNTLK